MQVQDKRKPIGFVPVTAYSRDTEACYDIFDTVLSIDEDQDMGYGSYWRDIPYIRAVLDPVTRYFDFLRICVLILSDSTTTTKFVIIPYRPSPRPETDPLYKKRFTCEITGHTNLTFFEALNSEVMG